VSAAALKVFVDTTAWLALANKSDRLHLPAVELNRNLLSQGAHYVTTDAVLAEVANSLARPPLRHAGIRFLDAIFSSRRVTILHVDPDRFARGWQLYKDRPDKDWGLTDCTSFVVMTEEGIREAFASDRHFEQAGYTRLMELP
jgi:predicted nucleic acid-binding protein